MKGSTTRAVDALQDPRELKDARAMLAELELRNRALRLQNQRLLRFAEATYAYQRQHHVNIKRIIDSLNALHQQLGPRSDLAPGGGVTSSDYVETYEDPLVSSAIAQLERAPMDASGLLPAHDGMGPSGTPSLRALIAHCTTLRHDDQLLEAFQRASEDQVDALQAGDYQLLLPTLLSWIHEGSNQDAVHMSIILTYMAFTQFPHLFERGTALQSWVRAYASELDRVCHRSPSSLVLPGVAPAEVEQLCSFFLRLSQG